MGKFGCQEGLEAPTSGGDYNGFAEGRLTPTATLFIDVLEMLLITEIAGRSQCGPRPDLQDSTPPTIRLQVISILKTT